MDRRLFFKSVFTSSLALPLAAALEAHAPAGGGALYVISDAPQDFLPVLLESAGRASGAEGRRLAFAQSHSLAEAVRRSLAGQGWTEAPHGSAPDIRISFAVLDRACPPSFTFIRNGRVVDLRETHLRELWTEMSGPGLRSSVLTSAVFPSPRSDRASGSRVSVLINGQRKESLRLDRDIVRTYESAGGFVTVRVSDGRARVEDSSCRQRICVCSGPVSAAGERVICAPGRFVLEVEGRGRVDTAIG